MASPASFTFEHTHRFTEAEYVELVAGSRQLRPRLIRSAIVLAVGVACLFSAYTLLLGVAILSFGALGVWTPHLIRGTSARTFRDSRLLAQPLTYGVSERELWVRAPAYSAVAGWSYAWSWRVRGDWLILACTGTPTVYLPVLALKEAGVYDHVLALARVHGKPFDRR